MKSSPHQKSIQMLGVFGLAAANRETKHALDVRHQKVAVVFKIRSNEHGSADAATQVEEGLQADNFD